VLKHDKHNPKDFGDGIKVYSDNVLLELQFPPQDSMGGFMEIMMRALSLAQEFLGEDYTMIAKAAHMFDVIEVGLRPKDNEPIMPPAWSIGCTPNFDAYKGEMNKMGPFVSGERTGSFHIHIGNAEWKAGKDERLMTRESKHLAVKLMDIFVGCAAVIICGDSSSKDRRKMYGKAGEFRPTPYGIEYRVLENYYLHRPISHISSLVLSWESLIANSGIMPVGYNAEVLFWDSATNHLIHLRQRHGHVTHVHVFNLARFKELSRRNLAVVFQ